MVRSINRRCSFSIFCGLWVLVAVGCQRGQTWNLASVEGTVTKSGRPLANIEVIFLIDPAGVAVGPRSTGRTDESGHYRLRTDNGEEGAVIGKHRVLVFDLKVSKQWMGRTTRGPLSPEYAKRLQDELRTTKGEPRVPPSYKLFNGTPLRVEVRTEAQVINLEVK
jgi:hypothetical protein